MTMEVENIPPILKLGIFLLKKMNDGVLSSVFLTVSPHSTTLRIAVREDPKKT